ncbi:MAG: sulfotransferase family 2 domain-containing protein [Crocosphaera sp.]
MIISHDYKFIFIKTNKTAGTSIEIALSKFCGPRDIITPISLEDEATRKDLGYRGPQNYTAPLRAYSSPIEFAKLFLKNKKLKFYNHISSEKIKQYISNDVWENYYKFCFERNPWDRFVSFYYWKTKKLEPRPTMIEFIKSGKIKGLRWKGYDLYTINDQVVVDRICRFENLSEDLSSVCKQLGIQEELELPRAKSSYRKDKRSYRDILGQQEKMMISEFFQKELNLLGYEF